MGIIEEVKQEIEANKDRIHRFWFSEKQRELGERMISERPYLRKFVTINGKRHEYTECVGGEFLEKKSSWPDAIYLGETSWRNVG